ncbi:MAG: hypothetical protein ABIN89_24895 [Chitinophagaceae bacterium]
MSQLWTDAGQAEYKLGEETHSSKELQGLLHVYKHNKLSFVQANKNFDFEKKEICNTGSERNNKSSTTEMTPVSNLPLTEVPVASGDAVSSRKPAKFL